MESWGIWGLEELLGGTRLTDSEVGKGGCLQSIFPCYT